MNLKHPILLVALFAGGFLMGYLVRGGSSTQPPAKATVVVEKTESTAKEGNTSTAPEQGQDKGEEGTLAEEYNDGENANTPPQTPIRLPSGQACFADDKELSLQLSLFAEKMEKQKVMYNNKEPEKLADCSGIFHRTVQFVASSCDQYLYPSPKDARDSRSLAKWFHEHGNLIFIQDAVKQRNVIKPGAVLFFGGSGKKYNNPPKEQVLAAYPAGIIEHMGVVTEVRYDANGDVEGYSMFHGRRPGVYAQRSHYHQLKPPRIGFPPLGNWNQQLLAVAYIMTPKEI